MTTVDFLLLALALAIAAAVAYLLDSGRLFSRDPYADFDRWQRCFHAGIEARRCGLDPNDNPFEDDVDLGRRVARRGHLPCRRGGGIAMKRTDAIEIAERIDAMDHEVTDWEADFIESILKSDRDPSPRQAKVLEDMLSKYEERGHL
jgi:hypothetical protein